MKTSVSAPVSTGVSGSDDSINDFDENSDDKESRWDKTKDFIYEHKVIITLVVFVVVIVIIAYVSMGTPPPIPPRNQRILRDYQQCKSKDYF
jgi:hypothetical protein